MSTVPVLTLVALRRRVAELLQLEPGEFTDEDLLTDFGLDSVRLMTLLEDLRTEGHQIDFDALAEHVTLSAWHTRIAASAQRPGRNRS